MGLFIDIKYVDATDDDDRTGAGEEPLHETEYTTTGALFRALQGRDRFAGLGRCTGKVYVDVPEGDLSVASGGPASAPAERPDGSRTIARQIGWVFVARVARDDEPGTWLREAWVGVHEAPPTVTSHVTPHYATF